MKGMNPEWIEGRGMTSKRTRERMVSKLWEQGIRNEQVLSVMAVTPRHIFVEEAMSHLAYEANALPIGFGQTISQPYIVARMTELLLAMGPLAKVLEVGTGCGYQSAILAQCVKQVVTLERVKPFLKSAAARWQVLGLNNIVSKWVDGTQGCIERAPYDGILITACAQSIPEALVQQLHPEGVMLLPLVMDSGEERLYRFQGAQKRVKDVFDPVHFVPLLPGLARGEVEWADMN
jgi:protein-L-isoaspartate(D-aspartate) O-methyltransferase